MTIAYLFGQPVTDLPKDLFIPPQALQVVLTSFEGPLDLLLYLIRKQNLDVLDIPMLHITEQYLGYINQMETHQFDLAAEYLLMAAVLIEIKSRLLLPQTHPANLPARRLPVPGPRRQRQQRMLGIQHQDDRGNSQA